MIIAVKTMFCFFILTPIILEALSMVANIGKSDLIGHSLDFEKLCVFRSVIQCTHYWYVFTFNR